MNVNAVQTLILENWFSIDNILFQNKNPKDVLNETQYMSYLTDKGCFLSNLYEIYMLGDLDIKKSKSLKGMKSLMESSLAKSNDAIKKAYPILKTSAKKELYKDVNKILNENYNVDEKSVVKSMSNQYLKSISIDNICFNENLVHRMDRKKLESWKGKVCRDAHNVLKESLIKSSKFNV